MQQTHTDQNAAHRPSLRLLAIGAMVMVSFSAPSTAVATLGNFFSAHQTESDDISDFTKWTGMVSRFENQVSMAKDNCADDDEDCDGTPAKMAELIKELKDKPLVEQIQGVNTAMNKVPYVTDRENWGVEDYWETPAEFLARGGDCEDYAIAKYMTLKKLGVSEDQMRLMIVTDSTLGGEMHAILEVKVDGERLILDNQAKHVLAEENIHRYHPLYAINDNNWWAYD